MNYNMSGVFLLSLALVTSIYSSEACPSIKDGSSASLVFSPYIKKLTQALNPSNSDDKLDLVFFNRQETEENAAYRYIFRLTYNKGKTYYVALLSVAALGSEEIENHQIVRFMQSSDSMDAIKFLGVWNLKDDEILPCADLKNQFWKSWSARNDTQIQTPTNQTSSPPLTKIPNKTQVSSTNPPTNPPTNQPTNPPTNPPNNPPTPLTTNQPASPLTNQPASPPTNQPANSPTNQPTISAPKPTSNPPTSQSTISTPKPTSNPIPNPTSSLTPNPTSNPTPIPTPNSNLNTTAIPTPNSTLTQTPIITLNTPPNPTQNPALISTPSLPPIQPFIQPQTLAPSPPKASVEFRPPTLNNTPFVSTQSQTQQTSQVTSQTQSTSQNRPGIQPSFSQNVSQVEKTPSQPQASTTEALLAMLRSRISGALPPATSQVSNPTYTQPSFQQNSYRFPQNSVQVQPISQSSVQIQPLSSMSSLQQSQLQQLQQLISYRQAQGSQNFGQLSSVPIYVS